MAIVIESATTTNPWYTSTVDKPSGTSTGDLLLAFVYSEPASGPPDVITGFTLLDSLDPFGGGSYTTLSFQYRIADGSEGSSFTVPDNAITLMARITGFDTDSPFGSGASFGYQSTSSLAIPSVTTTVADALLVSFGHTNPASDPDPVTIGGESPDFFFDSYSGSANQRGFVNGEVIAATGATGTRAFAAAVSSARWAGMVAIAPAADDPPPDPDPPAAPARAWPGLMLPV